MMALREVSQSLVSSLIEVSVMSNENVYVQGT